MPDYEPVARVLRQVVDLPQRATIATRIASAIKYDDPEFELAGFAEACGIPQELWDFHWRWEQSRVAALQGLN